jgi:hypothetical protein
MVMIEFWLFGLHPRLLYPCKSTLELQVIRQRIVAQLLSQLRHPTVPHQPLQTHLSQGRRKQTQGGPDA